MRIVEDVKLDFADVLIVPKRSELASRSEVNLVRTLTFKHSPREYSGIPIIAANMDGVGTIAMAKELGKQKLGVSLTKHIEPDDLIAFFNTPESFHAIYSMGMTKNDIEKYELVASQSDVFAVCVDVANGYTQAFSDFIKKFREFNPEIILIAGNVATPEMTQQLLLDGADIVKIGIGPGNACSTRIKTGVGYPQLSAIIECADAAHGMGGWIIGDGGISTPGDAAKAFAAGADFIMVGTMLAGHTEGGGIIIYDPEAEQAGKPCEHVEFYGMSSKKAQEAHGDSLKDYRASEGRVLRVPYKGHVAATVQDLLGGLRSACTYSGATSLKDLPKCATFVRVNRQISMLHGLGQL